uniref:Uncharacterized protein n=1 Tax=Panagrellus redivivus TaxID=6233 RepID=A0A7E4VYR3_PANRE
MIAETALLFCASNPAIGLHLRSGNQRSEPNMSKPTPVDTEDLELDLQKGHDSPLSAPVSASLPPSTPTTDCHPSPILLSLHCFWHSTDSFSQNTSNRSRTGVSRPSAHAAQPQSSGPDDAATDPQATGSGLTYAPAPNSRQLLFQTVEFNRQR